MSNVIWSGFHLKSVRERQEQLRLMYPGLNMGALDSGGLSLKLADVMVENCIGTVALPLGLGIGVTVNGQTFNVPMAVEEPSIIAAVSGTAKLVRQHGGLTGSSTGNIMIGQVQLLDVKEPHAAAARIQEKSAALLLLANRFCPKMVERGGGVRAITARLLERRRGGAPTVVVHFETDVCEAMGANIINTVAEGIAPELARLTGARIGLRILSNLSTGRMARASFSIPVEALTKGGLTGINSAQAIVEAQRFAEDDAYRAATHNKGVMNGIDSVAIATGQDWRALEAGAHAWAARSGTYQPLTSYDLSEDGRFLRASIELPMAVGTKGGALQTHPSYKLALEVLGNPNAQTLGQVIAAVGLLQNFAALRALATEGIQRGHMSLHARNIAVAAGAPDELVAEVAAYMVSRQRIDSNTAAAYLEAHHLFKTSHGAASAKETNPPSTLRVALEDTELNAPFVLDVVFETVGHSNVHLELSETPKENSLEMDLFGEKGVRWLRAAFLMLSQMNLSTKAPARENLVLQTRLKLTSILLNLLVHRLMAEDPECTAEFVRRLSDGMPREVLFQIIPRKVTPLAVGLPLTYALYKSFDSSLSQWMGDVPVAAALRHELQSVLSAVVKPPSRETFEALMSTHSKRWHVTIMILCNALGLSPRLLNQARVEVLQQVGLHFEWVSTCIHDLARHSRDAKTGAPNAYLVWLQESSHPPGRDSERAFLEKVEQRIALARSQIFVREGDVEELFDADLFENALKSFRTHYGI